MNSKELKEENCKKDILYEKGIYFNKIHDMERVDGIDYQDIN